MSSDNTMIYENSMMLGQAIRLRFVVYCCGEQQKKHVHISLCVFFVSPQYMQDTNQLFLSCVFGESDLLVLTFIRE